MSCCILLDTQKCCHEEKDEEAGGGLQGCVHQREEYYIISLVCYLLPGSIFTRFKEHIHMDNSVFFVTSSIGNGDDPIPPRFISPFDVTTQDDDISTVS